jgi:hypothetical protein
MSDGVSKSDWGLGLFVGRFRRLGATTCGLGESLTETALALGAAARRLAEREAPPDGRVVVLAFVVFLGLHDGVGDEDETCQPQSHSPSWSNGLIVIIVIKHSHQGFEV